MVEIYQNCNVFNDGAFEIFTDKGSKKEEVIFLNHQQPLVFGENDDKGIRLNGSKPEVVMLDQVGRDELWIHDETDSFKAQLLSDFFDDPAMENHLPRPFGILYSENRQPYEEAMENQIEAAIEHKGAGVLDDLLSGKNVWEVK